MKEGEDCKMIMISRSQYQNLIKFVEDKFDRDQNGKFILILPMLCMEIMMHFMMPKEPTAFFIPVTLGQRCTESCRTESCSLDTVRLWNFPAL
jgi:hypothetical protein